MTNRTRTWWMLATAILASPFCLTVALNAAGDINNPASIEDFIGCLNQRLQGTKPDISNTAQCLPKGCKVLMTMGEQSAQAACTLAGCQLPRVILNCPGPKDKDGKDQGARLRPSFLLCPRDSRPHPDDVKAGADDEYGFNRVEIGEDQGRVNVPAQTGNMTMADIPIHPGADYMMKTVDGELSRIIKDAKGMVTNRGSKACNKCHTGPTGMANDVGKPQISNPVDPYTPSESQNNSDLRPYVIFDYPDGSRIVPDDKKVDANGKRIQVGGVNVTNVTELQPICDCIEKNGDAIEKAARAGDPKDSGANPEFKIGTLKALCKELLTYQNTKACGKAPGTTCANAAGGGKFLDSRKNVSILRFDMTGDATQAANSLNFLDRDGTLSAYNYVTRKTIDQVAFNSLDISLTNGAIVNGVWTGDIHATGLAVGRVSGTAGNTNLWFQLDRKGGTLTFELRNGDSGTLLAGGTGEAGRSDFAVKPRVP